MTETRRATRIGQRVRIATIAAMPLLIVLLSSCGGSAPAPPPTSPAGSVATQIAPVTTVVAPAQTQVATVLAPISTQVATVAAPVQTQIATVAAPVATIFDPIVATVQAQVGGVRPTQQGACPGDHPIKGRTELLPPRRDYWLPGSAGYDQAVATICFSTEADAQAALYRKAGS